MSEPKPSWPAHDDDGVWYCDVHGRYDCEHCSLHEKNKRQIAALKALLAIEIKAHWIALLTEQRGRIEAERKLAEMAPAFNVEVSAVQALARAEDEIEKLEEALRPFAHLASRFPTVLRNSSPVWGYDDVEVTAGDFRRAAEAMKGEK